MRDHADEQLAFAGVLGPLVLDDVLEYARRANRIGSLQVMRADRVVGAEHLLAAWQHARRAMEEGRAQAERPEVEFLRHLAGERQIQRALEKMGITDGAASAVVVGLGPKRLDALQYFLHAISLNEDDGLADASEEKLRAFGITEKQLKATTPGRRMDLALEAVASVDLMRS
jgi:tRNA threonylcarbamoyladenosine modification (KEOPS) complex Cgi121 subunit